LQAKSDSVRVAFIAGGTRIMARRALPHARCQHAVGEPMESVSKQALLDADGLPLDPRIAGVLRELLPRFRNRFLTLDDEVLVTEIFEEAGQRIRDCETASGPVNNLKAYAWTTVVNVARSRLRHSSMRMARATLDSKASQAVLGTMKSHDGTPEQIEADILLEELLATLTAEERVLCMRKQSGFSSREIAREQGTSVARVDTLFYRIKRKFRDALNKRTGASLSTTSQATRTRTA
jgi:RNA polymerase sigma factor (sigma-70 family)